MNLDQIVPVLEHAIVPVIVISGVGLILLSMTNRYSGVVTRFRVLAESLRSGAPSDPSHVRDQLSILFRRARVLRLAIALATVSLLLAAFLIIALFLMAITGFDSAAVVIVLFIACMVSLSLGLLVFLYDVNASLAAMKLEHGLRR